MIIQRKKHIFWHLFIYRLSTLSMILPFPCFLSMFYVIGPHGSFFFQRKKRNTTQFPSENAKSTSKTHQMNSQLEFKPKTMFFLSVRKTILSFATLGKKETFSKDFIYVYKYIILLTIMNNILCI